MALSTQLIDNHFKSRFQAKFEFQSVKGATPRRLNITEILGEENDKVVEKSPI